MVPVCRYRFYVYEGSNQIGTWDYWHPYTRPDSDNSWTASGDNALMPNGWAELFGQMCSVFRDGTKPLPSSTYAQVNVQDVCQYNSSGYTMQNFAGKTLDLYLDKARTISLRLTITHTVNTSSESRLKIDYKYVKNNTVLMSDNYTCVTYYSSNEGSYSATSMSLPDWNVMLNGSANDNASVYLSTSCGSRYTTQSGLPSAQPRSASIQVKRNVASYSKAFFQSWLGEYTPYVPDPNDPYIDVDDSEPSGPAEGTGIPASDPVDIPGLPGFSITDTGFVTLFNPTLTQVKNLADYMWNGLFDVNNFKKILADPMDCILGFNMVPVAVPSGAAANISIGNLITSVSMNVATGQWVEVDCGSLDIGLPYGSYLDYSPYTKFSIYLPYIGTCELSADDVAGQVLTLKYHVDALSCSCVAYLKCGDHVLYQWTGSCGYSIPVTQNDFSRMIEAVVSLAAAGVGGGAAVTGAGLLNAGAAAAKNVSTLKPEVHRSGAIGSSAGLMGGQTPYLIIEIPNACKPASQYHYTGYPGFITVKVGDLTGYAEFEEIILNGISCTEEERSMIESLCKGGIYV